MNPLTFRKALGTFPTGVTVVTTATGDGEPVGLTCSSFNSVSLSPPLVSWALRKESGSLEVFKSSRRFAVHILAEDQIALSNRFASSKPGRFDGLHCKMSKHGTPIIEHCSARFECKTAYEYEGGDHIIFVGEVIDQELIPDLFPLLFHNGAYAQLKERVNLSDAQDATLAPDLTSPLHELAKPK